MALDYAQLKADLAAWAVRDDITSQIPSFIRLAEAEISRVARVLEQETDTTLTCSTPSYEVALPTGYLGFKHLYVTGSTDPRTEYLPPTLFHDTKNAVQDGFSARSGALQYTIESGKLKVMAGQGALSDIVLNVTYIKRFTELSDGSTDNWLINNHYDLYLWASLKELWDFTDETELVAKYTQKFDRVVAQLDKVENRKRIASGPLVSRPPAVVF